MSNARTTNKLSQRALQNELKVFDWFNKKEEKEHIFKYTNQTNPPHFVRVLCGNLFVVLAPLLKHVSNH